MDDDKQIKTDAKRAVYCMLVINLFVVLFAVLDGPGNKFVATAIVAQLVYCCFLLVPIFLYQRIKRKVSSTLALQRALASFRHVSMQ